jgi:cellulose synthase/poly-beta-1,6-N-acetylglucosamine synthase-like glycosyltransferase
MRAPRDASPKMRIAEFAWVVKNQVRPTGLHRLGLPCQLMGTGMAFPWSSINSAVLASGHIVEDLRLGIDLALVGTAPLFCPDALVTSSFPTSSEGIQGQRTRWEHGHLGVILQDAPRLLCRSIASFSASLTALTLDLCVPPLALLTILVVANWGVALTFYCLMKAKFPLVISTISALLLALSVYLSWVRYGRKIISFRGLAYALIYAALKIPLYARFLAVRQIEWVRSKRDGEK